jgi:oxalate decarboxylase/phosphoglucose isomerase-like protein (cupin superfamily)
VGSIRDIREDPAAFAMWRRLSSTLDQHTGRLSRCTGYQVTRLRDMAPLFADREAVEVAMDREPERAIHEVFVNQPPTEGPAYGTTVVPAGRVGHEYHMTRGQVRLREGASAIDGTVRGCGAVVPQDGERQVAIDWVRPGPLPYGPGRCAHRGSRRARAADHAGG